ncbi:MAG: hypothetical protein AAF557_20025 [Pseudomonadota bacterium]
MVRLVGVVLIGVAFGLGLVAVITVMGASPATDAGVAAAVSVNEEPLQVDIIEAEDPITVPRVETVDQAPVYPPAFYLWQDGYPADPYPEKWTTRHLKSLASYLSDWKLPPEIPNKDGKLSLEVEVHISRQHPERSARLIRTVDLECQVWIERPLAQEEVTWEGACKDGLADGEGVLTRSYVMMGELHEIGYQGPMKAGKAHGSGKTVDSNFMMYKGDHADGLYHGKGTLIDLDYDGVYRYAGNFQNGYPHGPGRKQRDNKVIDGDWENGCFAGPEYSDWVLRHAIECPGRSSTDALKKLFD